MTIRFQVEPRDVPPCHADLLLDIVNATIEIPNPRI